MARKGRVAFPEYNKPPAQTAAATNRATTPTYQLYWSPGERPDCTLGGAKIDTPISPSSRAKQIIQLGRGPRRAIQAKMVRKTGTVATRSAAVPEGTYCSAK